MTNLWQSSRTAGPIVALAPMDGYCDSAFRTVCKTIAPEIVVFSEFYSSDGLKHNPLLARQVLTHDQIEHPLIVQIFGDDPDTCVTAGKIIQSYGISGIDINMGCPAKKVVTCGYGSSLMINHDNAYRIVNALATNLHIPVSVKTRLGWGDTANLITFAQGLEQAGCSLLTVHGRTYQQGFSGQADWSSLFELKKTLKIPLLGNGDVCTYDDGVRRIQHKFWQATDTADTSGNICLDGFMIGRASIGNPWCFLPDSYVPSLGEILDIMLVHARRIIDQKGEQRGCRDIRKHLVNYLRAFDGAKAYRHRLVQVESHNELRDILDEIRQRILHQQSEKPDNTDTR